MTTRRELEVAAPTAIPSGDTDRRLAAIIRRHGGKPYTPPDSRVVLPNPPRGHRKGQLTLPTGGADVTSTVTVTCDCDPGEHDRQLCECGHRIVEHNPRNVRYRNCLRCSCHRLVRVPHPTIRSAEQ